MNYDDKKLLGTIYDILADNDVSTQDREAVLEFVDHVDYDKKQIVFISPRHGNQFSLTLERYESED